MVKMYRSVMLECHIVETLETLNTTLTVEILSVEAHEQFASEALGQQQITPNKNASRCV